jgi:hypothetical protein
MQTPARYLVIIESGGASEAHMYTAERRRVAEFDPTEEVSVMTQGLVPQQGAEGSEWDPVLGGHSRAERAAALVYTLDV